MGNKKRRNHPVSLSQAGQDEHLRASPHGTGAQSSNSLAYFEHLSYESPLPPPQVLAQYNVVSPGLADRIVEWTQTQTAHRMRLEDAVVFGDVRRANWGLVLGFAVAIAFWGESFWLVIHRAIYAGAAFGGAPLATLAGCFVYGTRVRSKERILKSAQMVHSARGGRQRG